MARLVIADHALACRLERAEMCASARFVEARARVAPDSGAQWIEIAGAYAMFDAPNSPCTQTFGLGLFQMPTAADMDRIEAFFKDRGAPVMHEVSPLADKAMPAMLHERGYRPVELSNVLFLPIGEDVQPSATNPTESASRDRPSSKAEWSKTDGSMQARVIDPDEREV